MNWDSLQGRFVKRDYISTTSVTDLLSQLNWDSLRGRFVKRDYRSTTSVTDLLSQLNWDSLRGRFVKRDYRSTTSVTDLLSQLNWDSLRGRFVKKDYRSTTSVTDLLSRVNWDFIIIIKRLLKEDAFTDDTWRCQVSRWMAKCSRHAAQRQRTRCHQSSYDTKMVWQRQTSTKITASFLYHCEEGLSKKITDPPLASLTCCLNWIGIHCEEGLSKRLHIHH